MWELIFWEFDVLGVDILGVDILGVDILRPTYTILAERGVRNLAWWSKVWRRLQIKPFFNGV